ncbi:hypothetical protein Y1Q_0016201 [Alligator mississippiensis]|uniref:Uncharacterized protein n=1 Tax=Alligator mississippiensis TaxID=8496 RepID=A0A151P169_ALLMI|nr:hypothetical protein Y1Q_0016201 [Alligator mississippiensis]
MPLTASAVAMAPDGSNSISGTSHESNMLPARLDSWGPQHLMHPMVYLLRDLPPPSELHFPSALNFYPNMVLALEVASATSR